MRDMSAGAHVPIEPPEQTRLLDACIALRGVVGGGVPGGASLRADLLSNTDLLRSLSAGGFDAIWVLVLDTPTHVVAGAVEKLWLEWTEVSVSPLLTDAGAGKQQGARVELLENVPGLAAIL